MLSNYTISGSRDLSCVAHVAGQDGVLCDSGDTCVIYPVSDLSLDLTVQVAVNLLMTLTKFRHVLSQLPILLLRISSSIRNQLQPTSYWFCNPAGLLVCNAAVLFFGSNNLSIPFNLLQ